MNPDTFWEEQAEKRSQGDKLERMFPCETANGGVAFYPDECVQRCLKCGLEGPAWVPRTVRAAYGAGYRQMVVRTLRVNLPICRHCLFRMGLVPLVVAAAFVMPFALIVAAALLKVPDKWFGPILMVALLSPFPLAWLGFKWSLRPKNVEADGMIELRGVHPDVRADLIAVRGGGGT